jgi:hypothetical protein
MDITGGDAFVLVHTFAQRTAVRAFGLCDWGQIKFGAGIMEAVSAHLASRQGGTLQCQGNQLLFHACMSGEQTQHVEGFTLQAGETVEQIEHAAAFSENGFVGLHMRMQRGAHGSIILQGRQVQLRISAGQINTMCIRRQGGVVQRRKEKQFGTKQS